MSAWLYYAAAGLVVSAIGAVGAFDGEEPVRRVVAINILSSGVFLVLVAVARRSPTEVADPVPHALVLTGIVVSVSATALALSLAKRLAHEEETHDGGAPAIPPPRGPSPREERPSEDGLEP